MATGPMIGDLLEEVTCSICLEYMKDPVSILCGHSFCLACITKYCVTFKSTKAAMSCPFCEKSFQEEDIRPNWILASLVSSLLTFEDKSENTAQEVWFCERHRERAFFYCQEDQQFLCVVCKDLIQHRRHSVLQQGKDARSYKDQIQSRMVSLMKEREEIKKTQQMREEAIQALMNQIQAKKQQVVSEYRQTWELLKAQQHLFLAEMETLEKEINSGKDEYVTKVSKELTYLDTLINKMEESSHSGMENLKDVKKSDKRWKWVQIPTPIAVSTTLENRVLKITNKADVLQERLKRFRDTLSVGMEKHQGKSGSGSDFSTRKKHSGQPKMKPVVEAKQKNVGPNWNQTFRPPKATGAMAINPKRDQRTPRNFVDHRLSYPPQSEMASVTAATKTEVVLDPDTAHPKLLISEDGKRVTMRGSLQGPSAHPKRFDTNLYVLGREGYSSGTHSWTVELSYWGDCILGVARESVRRKGRISLSQREGIWALRVTKGQFWALTIPENKLSLDGNPQKVGVTLDFRKGQVTFSNADKEATIFTFQDSFTGKIVPFFGLYGPGAQLTLYP
ncbi:tripartite motif-containing protein 10-like isoform X2 [Choloepus didactylus]|uniref:tripartite motif-containing protein 10-like isoform X2 n=1 Tax=Choloepus didactylus TaxID=27675 RepID=UPI0018A097AA|nr:tripartite motif-containing protein 10-like isoform X2 [Choloepus didactylus]